MARWEVGAQAGCSQDSAAGGRRMIRARLVFWRSGANGMGTNTVVTKPTFLGVFKMSARSCEPPSRALALVTLTFGLLVLPLAFLPFWPLPSLSFTLFHLPFTKFT